jgi:hypothetical protein
MSTDTIERGPLPAQLKKSLAEWDAEPLPETALLKFQVVGRGPSPKANYRWLLYEDGRWFMNRHSGDTSRSGPPFDTPWPASPTKQLPSDVVKTVKNRLQQEDFFKQPAHQLDPGVRGGSFYIVTARQNGQEHRVVYAGYYPPLAEYLEELTYTYEE